jgi:hypothetical protein
MRMAHEAPYRKIPPSEDDDMTNRHANVLSRAAVLLGGVPVLAQRLNVRPEDLLAWIADKKAAPESVVANVGAIVNAYEVDLTGTRLIRLTRSHTVGRGPAGR